jgi:pyruvate dehydrogenase E1 component alpha subunit
MMIEFDTYRYHGHSMSDPGSTYRTRDEISTMRQQRDPVEHVRKLLLDNGFADASELKKLEKVRLCDRSCEQIPAHEDRSL